ncbi:MAG TPA: rod shape-determining protein MreD [Candidatus Saccharimonadia bacterium]|nr:rod shape-determining protein MreD [Candidatus Saccharimonadia bacterium]
MRPGGLAGLTFWGSVALALVLTLMPLPDALRAAKPFWVAIVVIYWALESPERMGLGRAFALGLVADLLTGSLLGEQALRLVVLAFITLRLRSRLRFFPMPQQTLAVLALLFNDRVVMLMIRSFTESAPVGLAHVAGPIAGALLWPWLFLLLDGLRLRTRPKDA